MTSIAIYMEGGGDSNNGRAALRQGMDEFLGELKQVARNRSWGWKLACVGSRNNAFRAFRRAAERVEADVVILLVDAEEPLQGAPGAHLRHRDGWEMGFAEENSVHLMVQTMEAWLLADGDALAAYCGQGSERVRCPRHRIWSRSPTGNRKGVGDSNKRNDERALSQDSPREPIAKEDQADACA